MPDKPSAYERRAVAQFIDFIRSNGGPYMVFKLDHYAQAKGLTWAQLAKEMGCTVETLNRVACCRAPEDEDFDAGIRYIAEQIGVDSERLYTCAKPVERELDRAAESRGLYLTGPLDDEASPGDPDAAEPIDDG
jgi:hypothetical protein